MPILVRLVVLVSLALYGSPLVGLISPQSTETVNRPNSENGSAHDGATEDRKATQKDEQSSAHQKEKPKPDRQYQWKLGTVSLGAGYSHLSGPIFYPGPVFYPYPGAFYSSIFWDPFWNSPFYAPGYLAGFRYGYGKGEVKLKADPKDAQVYVNGAYAGRADQLRTIWLDPGAYDLSLSSANHELFQQRIYVLSGKSLSITTKLGPAKILPPQEPKR